MKKLSALVGALALTQVATVPSTDRPLYETQTDTEKVLQTLRYDMGVVRTLMKNVLPTCVPDTSDHDGEVILKCAEGRECVKQSNPKLDLAGFGCVKEDKVSGAAVASFGDKLSIVTQSQQVHINHDFEPDNSGVLHVTTRLYNEESGVRSEASASSNAPEVHKKMSELRATVEELNKAFDDAYKRTK